MAKGKKKKKDLDFQKVKIKVGRKLKRDSNETKAEFKTRKIVIKEVKSYSDDPLTALAHHGDRISQHGKLSMLNHFNAALTPDIVQSLSKPIIDSLSKFIVDHSDQVRAATIKCLKTCFNHIRQQHLSTKDFMQSLKPYLDCAYTHLSKGIVYDCQKMLENFVNTNDPSIFEPLMAIILRRYEAGNLTEQIESLAIKLRRYYIRHKQKQNLEELLKGDKVGSLVWNERNNLIDLDFCIHDLNCNNVQPEREAYLVVAREKENIVDRYLEVVIDKSELFGLTNGGNSAAAANCKSNSRKRPLNDREENRRKIRFAIG